MDESVIFMLQISVYCLGVFEFLEGASLGLQASGFPSGAQHVPFTVPCGDAKLQSTPLLADLHATSASVGGLGGPPFPSAVWAESPLQAESAAAKIVRANTRLNGMVDI